MTTSNEKQINYVGPFLTMVFLFLVVGFLTTVNQQFQLPLQDTFLAGVGKLKNTMTTLITFSWFLAYPLCGGIGSRWIGKVGYKRTLLRALFVMIGGLALFYLSSVVTDVLPQAGLTVGQSLLPYGFFIFLLGSFVVGASATIMQVVINPYLTACSVKGTQPIQRLAIGGTANSVGTTVAPYFVTGIVFSGVAMSQVRAAQLQIPFLVLIAVLAMVVLILWKLTLPEIEGTGSRQEEKLEKSVWSFKHLKLGVIAIFFYVGVEVCIGANINLYANELGITSSILLSTFATCYWGGLLIGRSVGSLLRTVPPRTQLLTTTIGAMLLLLFAVMLNNIWLLVAVGLCHSIMWGAIFTLSTTGLGKYTSVASGVFMIGVIGGGILPLLQGALADWLDSWRWSWVIVIGGELYMLYYAWWGSRVRQVTE